MNIDEYLEIPDSTHKQQGNPSVVCNAISKTSNAINVYLTPAQAIAFARNLLQKAQVILEDQIEDAVVHVWNVGKEKETVYCGVNKARKKGQKGSKKGVVQQ